MKIELLKDDVFPVLSQIQGILEKRSALPVFANILITAKSKDQILIYASDSELSFSSHISGSLFEPGTLVVDGKKLFEIVRELNSDPFHLSLGENFLIKLKQNQSLFKIHGLNPDDFPVFPPLKQKSTQKILAVDFLSAIDKTLYCVSLDESRYHLTGVFLEQTPQKKHHLKLADKKAKQDPLNYRFVATDGYRMSFIDIKGGESKELKKGIIIPKKGLQEARKMLSHLEKNDQVEFCVEKPRLLIKFKGQSLNIRLIEGEYPQYKTLLPKEKGKEAIVSTGDFLSALRRISALTSARFKGVDFIFKDGSLKMEFSHPDIGSAKEEISCEYPFKEALNIRFNSKYILDIVQSISESKLRIILETSIGPGLIQPEDKKNYTCLVMPMKS